MVSAARVSVDTQTKVDFGLELGQLTEAVTVTAAQGQLLKTDRADVATTFDARQVTELPDPGPQLHQAHPAHPGHPAAELGPRGQREPAGLHADRGERADLQRHRLPARRHRQPRPHPRHHRHQPEPGGDRRDQDHLPELRRRVRPGHRGRRLGADQVGHQRAPRQRCSSSCSATSFQARNPFTQPDREDPITGRVLPETKRDQFGGSIGGPIAQNKFFFFADYQGTRANIGGSQAADRPHRGRAHAATSARTA